MNSQLYTLLSLLSEDKYCTLQELSQKLSRSTKTTRNLLKALDEDLRSHGAELVTKYGRGYLLQVNDPSLYGDYLQPDTAQKPAMETQQDRVTALLDCLCSSKQYIRMEELEERLYISRQTLSGDVKAAEQMMEKHHIRLLRRPNYGIRAEGSEWDLRMCICDYAEERCHAEKEHMGSIGGCLAQALKEFGCYMEIRFFRRACVYLSVMLQRTAQGRHLPQMEISADREACGVARRTLRLLENAFQTMLPYEEAEGFCRILQGKVLTQSETAPAKNIVISPQISDLVTRILQAVYDAFRIDLRSDLDLIVILSKHLTSLRDRVTQNLTPPNPMLHEFKEKYGLAFVMAAHAAAVINHAYQIELNEDEIGYLAFGFALALEQQKTGVDPKNVLLVSNTGHGSAQLLVYKIKQQFGRYIKRIETCDVGALFTRDLRDIDYIISTTQIDIPVAPPILQIDYFLNRSISTSIEQALQRNREQFQHSIVKYYPEELFLPHLSDTTKEDVLKTMCDHMIREKKLSPEFYDLVLERESLAKTAFGNLTAIPHASRTVSSETFVCVGILEKPILWDEQKVQVVFLISVANCDHTSQELQNFYRVTTEFLTSTQCVRELIRNRDHSAFLDTMTQLEKSVDQHI